MSELVQDAWFFTREGERLGPVTFAELRGMVSQARLNPRLDLVWTQGMAEWKAAGEIEGLFERRSAPEPAESLAPPADPYAPPKQESVTDMMQREGEWPGARRRSFLIATILFPFAWNLAFTMSAGLLKQQLGPEIMGVVGIGAAFLPAVVGIYFGLQRLVNLGMSRWWYLANLVPFLNFWVGYRCFACPAGYAYHKKLDGVGVALAIIYWLLMVLCFIAIVAILAVLLGAAGDPEIRDRFFEALRAAREQAVKP